MDRLARNMIDLRQLVDCLTARGVTIKFRQEGLTFTGENSFLARLQLTLLGACAEFVLAKIRENQLEGINLAKQRGVYKGRKPSLTSQQIDDLKKRVANGEKKDALARELGISRETLYQYLRTAK